MYILNSFYFLLLHLISGIGCCGRTQKKAKGPPDSTCETGSEGRAAGAEMGCTGIRKGGT